MITIINILWWVAKIYLWNCNTAALSLQSIRNFKIDFERERIEAFTKLLDYSYESLVIALITFIHSRSVFSRTFKIGPKNILLLQKANTLRFILWKPSNLHCKKKCTKRQCFATSGVPNGALLLQQWKDWLLVSKL